MRCGGGWPCWWCAGDSWRADDRCKFVVESVQFNALLYQATRDLVTIARFTGQPS